MRKILFRGKAARKSILELCDDEKNVKKRKTVDFRKKKW